MFLLDRLAEKNGVFRNVNPVAELRVEIEADVGCLG
jgi:hypothetical protein